MEPLWTQMVPQTATSQYILFWYVAETVPPDVEALLNARDEQSGMSLFGTPYQYPPKFPLDLKIKDRIAMEPSGFEPKRHADTSADEEEALYQSHLLPVDEAIAKLGVSIQGDVVRKGWKAIQQRKQMEL